MNSKKIIDLTIVVPFYNPGDALLPHINGVISVLEVSGFTFEVIAISDGSKDGSENSIRSVNSQNFRIISLPTNQGKGAALRAALSQGEGSYLGFIDGDGDIPAECLNTLLEKIRNGTPDIVYGSKNHPNSSIVYPRFRYIYSWVYQRLIRALFKISVSDTQTGIKLYRRELLNAALPLMLEKKFAFDLELFVVARQKGFTNYIDVPVKIKERLTTTISLRSVRDVLQDTLAIFYRLKILNYYDKKNDYSTNLLQKKHLFAFEEDEMRSQESLDIQKHNILIFNWKDLYHPKAGGAEIYTQSIAHSWVATGNHVTLFCSNVAGRPKREIVNGVNIVRDGNKYSVYRKAKKFYKAECIGKYDLIIDEINTRPFFAHKWATDTKVIGLCHQICKELWSYQYWPPISTFGRYVLEPKWLHSLKNVPIITVSNSSKESLIDYGINDITVLPEGHEPNLKPVTAAKEQNPTVLFVGRLEAHKRPEDSMRAFAILRERLPNAVMWVIGTGPSEMKLRNRNQENVIFFGSVSHEEKLERMARAHVLVVTSVREGWGLVVSEAAELGTTTVAYDVPGLRDSVNASSGILTPQNPKELAVGIENSLLKTLGKPVNSISNTGTVLWSELASAILEKLFEK